MNCFQYRIVDTLQLILIVKLNCLYQRQTFAGELTKFSFIFSCNVLSPEISVGSDSVMMQLANISKYRNVLDSTVEDTV